LGSGVGFISALILGINNLRDIKTDRDTLTKKTLAVIFGEKFQRNLCLLFLLLSQVMVIIFVVSTEKYYALFELIIPLLFYKTWINIYMAPVSSSMNDDLANTGKFLFLYCLSLSILINLKV
jgi:1,4-dihydroxy-2-naphthoate octaprenyltransferase